MNTINKDTLNNFIQDPNDAINCIKLANEYFINKQYSAAVTYYLKAAEAAEETQYHLKYGCLLSISQCYRILGNRRLGAIQYARFAKAECPDRPEAYYMLATILAEKLYDENCYEQGEWIQVYENAKIGSIYAKVHDGEPSIYYTNKEHLFTIYAISLLRLGKLVELKEFLNEYRFNSIDDPYVMNTIEYIYYELKLKNPYQSYDSKDIDKLNLQFEGIESINGNYSRMMQDMLVATLIDGNFKNCKFIDIAPENISQYNNTKLLEDNGSEGLIIPFEEYKLQDFTNERSSEVTYISNLTSDNLNKELITDKIKYISIALKSLDDTQSLINMIDFNNVVDIITLQHNIYYNQDKYELLNNIRRFLSDKGYIPLIDMKSDLQTPFEDWFILPTRLDTLIVNSIKELYSKSDGIVTNLFYK